MRPDQKQETGHAKKMTAHEASAWRLFHWQSRKNVIWRLFCLTAPSAVRTALHTSAVVCYNHPIMSTPSFTKQLLSDKDVAAVSPSSHFLVRRVLRCLRPERLRSVIEFGPGPGVVTLPLLKILGQEARYAVIEKNPEFASTLRKIGDARLTVIEGDARDAKRELDNEGITSANAVLASIPFTYLTPDERRALVAEAWRLLDDDGDFVVFHQYSCLMLPYLRERFPRVKIMFEPLNLLPCFVFHCRKS